MSKVSLRGHFKSFLLGEKEWFTCLYTGGYVLGSESLLRKRKRPLLGRGGRGVGMGPLPLNLGGAENALILR